MKIYLMQITTNIAELLGTGTVFSKFIEIFMLVCLFCYFKKAILGRNFPLGLFDDDGFAQICDKKVPVTNNWVILVVICIK